MADTLTMKTPVKAVQKNASLLLNDERVQLTSKRFVAGRNVPSKFRVRGVKSGYIFGTESDGGELFVLPNGYLEVLVDEVR